MNPIGPVTVTATTVVKAVSAIGIAVGGAGLAITALGLMVQSPLNTQLLANAAMWAIPFLAGVVGWQFADHINGEMFVNNQRDAQQAELERLQSYHGQSL